LEGNYFVVHLNTQNFQSSEGVSVPFTAVKVICMQKISGIICGFYYEYNWVTVFIQINDYGLYKTYTSVILILNVRVHCNIHKR
jgi:hypothetical protein